MRRTFTASRLLAFMALALVALPLALAGPAMAAATGVAPPAFSWGLVFQLAQQAHLTQLVAGVAVTYLVQLLKAVTIADPLGTSALRLASAVFSLALGIVTVMLSGDVTAFDAQTLVTGVLDALIVFGASVVAYHGVAKPANDAK